MGVAERHQHEHVVKRSWAVRLAFLAALLILPVFFIPFGALLLYDYGVVDQRTAEILASWGGAFWVIAVAFQIWRITTKGQAG